MEYQTSLTQGQPDDEAVRLLQYYEALALENDPRGYCVCTSEGKDSRVLREAAQMTEEELLDFIRASLPRLSAEGAKRVMRELLEEAYAEAQDAAEC